MTASSLEQKKTGFLNMPKLPFAGFFQRLLAFLIDIILVVMGIQLLSRPFENFLFSLGESASYATGLLMFLYFAGFNGPAGGGRTIGKIILRMRVTDFDGNTPTWRQSIIRTVVLMPFFITAPLANVVFDSGASTVSAFWYQLIVPFAFVAVAVSTCIVIPFNPFKQGMHDYLAATLVRPTSKTAYDSFETVAAGVGPGWKTFHKQPQISGVVTLVMVYSLLGYMAYQGYFSFPERRAFHDAVYALEGNSGIPGVSIGPTPRLPLEQYGDENVKTIEEFHLRIRQEEEVTTSTITQILTVSRPSRWPYDPTAEDKRKAMEQLAIAYHETCYPRWISVLNSELQNNEWTDGDPRADILRLRTANRPIRPVKYVLLFQTAVHRFPHTIPLMESKGQIEVEVPALGLQ